MSFILGAWIGVSWMFLNSVLLMRLVRTAVIPGQEKKQILWLGILKFPVLYLAGFFILSSRFFSVGGILAGLTVGLAGLIVWWVRHGIAPRSVA